MPPPLRTSNSEYSSANLYFLRRLSLLYRKRFSHFYNTDTALLSSSLFPFYPFVLCSSLIDGYFSSTNIHSNRFDLRLNILIVRRNWTQTNFSTLTRYYFTYILFHPISNVVSILLSNSHRENEARANTHDESKYFIDTQGGRSDRFGADRAPLRNRRKKRDETKQNRSHINHLSQFRGRKDRLRSKSFHWGSVVGCATSQLRAVARCETGDRRGTKARNTPLVGTI